MIDYLINNNSINLDGNIHLYILFNLTNTDRIDNLVNITHIFKYMSIKHDN